MASEKFEPRKDIVIQGNLAHFHISENGAYNGLYTGEFIFRCVLNPSQGITANREYREMLGANPTLADERISFMAYALAELKQRIVKAPPFWTNTESGLPGDIPDENVLTAVLDAAIHAQLKYRHELEARKLEILKKAVAQAEKIVNGKPEESEEEDGEELEEGS